MVCIVSTSVDQLLIKGGALQETVYGIGSVCLYCQENPKKLPVTVNRSKNGQLDRQGAKKVSFASPRVISTSPKKFCDEHWLQFFGNLNSLKELCLLGWEFPGWDFSHLAKFLDFYGYSLNTLKYPKMGIRYFFLCVYIKLSKVKIKV